VKLGARNVQSVDPNAELGTQPHITQSFVNHFIEVPDRGNLLHIEKVNQYSVAHNAAIWSGIGAVPEPSTFAVVLSGAVMVIARRFRKRRV
jgi:hypothetical protein